MELTDENYVDFALEHYDNPQCLTVEEFNSDLNRVRHIKRLIGRYLRNDDLKERLILNHLVIFHNVFGIEAGIDLLLHKMDIEAMPALKTFLLYLNYIREDELDEIPIDMHIAERLRSLK